MGDLGRLGSEVIKELLYLYALEPGQYYDESDLDTIKFFEIKCRDYIERQEMEVFKKKYVSPPTYIEQYMSSMPNGLDR